MRKFLTRYTFAYIGITWLYWIVRGFYNEFIFLPSITDEAGMYHETDLLAHMVRTIPQYFISKTIIFALVPLFFSIVRQRWQNLVGTWGILALLSIIGDFVFGVLGSALFFRLVEWLFF